MNGGSKSANCKQQQIDWMQSTSMETSLSLAIFFGEWSVFSSNRSPDLDLQLQLIYRMIINYDS